MRRAVASVSFALVAALSTGSAAVAALAPARSGIPQAVTAAARAMHCDLVNQMYSSLGEKPVFSGATCKTKR